MLFRIFNYKINDPCLIGCPKKIFFCNFSSRGIFDWRRIQFWRLFWRWRQNFFYFFVLFPQGLFLTLNPFLTSIFGVMFSIKNYPMEVLFRWFFSKIFWRQCKKWRQMTTHYLILMDAKIGFTVKNYPSDVFPWIKNENFFKIWWELKGGH